MPPLPRPLSDLPWTADLAIALADASSAIARLDARICASSFAPAWKLRASWTGYAAALRLQQFPLEEIDIIAENCGIRLAGREAPSTAAEPFAAYHPWLARLAQADGRHWREDLPFSFDPPTGWAEAPVLVRALALLDHWARADGSSAPWLGLPLVLRRLGITTATLPCLVVGDAGQRFALDPRPVLLKRLLKQLRRSAEEGVARLDRLEETARRSAATIATEHRPGKLAELGRVALSRPCLAARSLAPLLDLTISGAGKLLQRAARLGLLVETSQRGTWRSYVAPDIAIALGFVAPDRGRPRAAPRPFPALDTMLAVFDSEMAALDARLERLADSSGPALSP